MYLLNHLNKLFVLFLICSVNLFSQESYITVLGVTSISNQGSPFKLGGGLSVMDGTNTIQTSYTVSGCGLNFVASSRRLCQRGGSPAGAVQPATFSVSGIP
jgi:hypothetical protein